MAYCAEHNIAVDHEKGKNRLIPWMPICFIFLMKEAFLEDPAAEAEEDMWLWSVSPENAPDEPTYIEIDFIQGDAVALMVKEMSAALFWKLE